MKELTDFLNRQDILQIAPQATEPWIANIMFLVDDNCHLYFAGNTKAKYALLIEQSELIAFATAWHAEANHINRKGIQGLGTCEIIEDENLVKQVVGNHNKSYPTLSGLVDTEFILDSSTDWRVFKITPSYIKFWNDEIYPKNKFKEFNF